MPRIRRYVFVGDQPGESEIRLGIFAGLRGDDDAGPKAIADFIDDLVAFPSLGSAFRIYSYPMLNPGSFETEAPFRPAGRRNRFNEIGHKVKSPEASLIERELFVLQFQGLIVIQTKSPDIRCRQGGCACGQRTGLKVYRRRSMAPICMMLWSHRFFLPGNRISQQLSILLLTLHGQ